MHIDHVVHSGQYEIGDSLEMVCYCQLKLQLQPDSATKICCHYRRDYFHITDINCEGDTDSQTQTVKGTLCFHSVHNTGIPGIVEVCMNQAVTVNHASLVCQVNAKTGDWSTILHGLLCTKSPIYLAISKTNFGMDSHCHTNQLEIF